MGRIAISNQDLKCLCSLDCNVGGYLFVSPNGECSNSVTRSSILWLLPSELLQHLISLFLFQIALLPLVSHFCRFLETVTRLANADIEYELVHSNILHGVVALVLRVIKVGRLLGTEQGRSYVARGAHCDGSSRMAAAVARAKEMSHRASCKSQSTSNVPK